MKRIHLIPGRSLFLFISLILFAGCHLSSHKDAAQLLLSKPIDTVYNASCPYLTKDEKGNPVLSWVQQENPKEDPVVCYAVFSGEDGTFGPPHPIPTSKGVEPHGENMPKIIFQKNGSIWAVFNVKNPHPGNPYTGAIYYTHSADAGKSWTPAQPLIKDTSESYDQRYFDLAVLPNNKIGMVWLNNSRPEGSTLYFACLNDNSLSESRIIGKHTCQCCRTDLLVDDSGKINVAWRDIYQDSIRDMFYSSSMDTGKTFSSPVRISPDNWVVDGCPHTGPSMAENSNGLHFTWFTMGGGGGVYYCHTKNEGKTFSSRQAVSELPSARHPQIVAMPDNDLAIVWDEGIHYKGSPHQRIGFQMRGPSGLLLDTGYITADSSNAAFPQIQVLNERQVLLAFTWEEGDRQQVRYKIVEL